MADPINYCSWLASSFCITQSEWATWTQAALTVGTFVFAMWRQKVTSNNAELKVAAAEEKLRDERVRNSKTRALATAIAIRVDVTSFLSLVGSLPGLGLNMKPSEVFEQAEKNLDLRLRAMDALDLMEATNAVLAVVDGAHSIHNYLHACRNQQEFLQKDRDYLTNACGAYGKLGHGAFEAVKTLVATGLRPAKAE